MIENSRVPSLLMFCYSFPPCSCYPTASNRSVGLATGLAEMGWRPIVVTRDLRNGCRCTRGNIVESLESRGLNLLRLATVELEPTSLARAHSAAKTWSTRPILGRPAIGARKLLTLGLLLREGRDDWIERAKFEGERLLRSERVDAVWTTSRPYRNAELGSYFQSKYGLPWVADLRDAISRTPNDSLKWRARGSSNRRFMSHLRSASAITAVSPEEAQRDSDALGRPIEVVPSGFDMQEWAQIRSRVRKPEVASSFRILYAGRFYKELQDGDVFFAGLRRYLDRRGSRSDSSVVIDYLGPNGKDFVALAMKWGVAGSVSDFGMKPVPEARQNMVRSDALLLFTAISGTSGVPGGKLYEYLATGNPILAVPGRDEYVRDVLSETKSGFCPATPEEVATVLTKMIDDHSVNGPSLPRPLSDLKAFSWNSRAEKLAGIISRCFQTATA